MRHNKSARRRKSLRKKSATRKKEKRKSSRESQDEICPLVHFNPSRKQKNSEKTSAEKSSITAEETIKLKPCIIKKSSLRPSKQGVDNVPQSITEERFCSQTVVETVPKARRSISVTSYSKFKNGHTKEKSAQTNVPKEPCHLLSWIGGFPSSILTDILNNAVSLQKKRKWPEEKKKCTSRETIKCGGSEEYKVALGIASAKSCKLRDAGTSAKLNVQVYALKSVATSAHMAEPLLLEAGAQTPHSFPKVCEKSICPSRETGTQTRNFTKNTTNSFACSQPYCPLRSMATQTKPIELQEVNYSHSSRDVQPSRQTRNVSPEQTISRNDQRFGRNSQITHQQSWTRDSSSPNGQSSSDHAWSRNTPGNRQLNNNSQQMYSQQGPQESQHQMWPQSSQHNQSTAMQQQQHQQQQQWNQTWPNGMCTCCTCYGQPPQNNPFCASHGIQGQTAPFCQGPRWEGIQEQSSQYIPNRSNHSVPQGWNSRNTPFNSMQAQGSRMYNGSQYPNNWSQEQLRDEYKTPSQKDNTNRGNQTNHDCICPEECEEPECEQKYPCPFTEMVMDSMAKKCGSNLLQTQSMNGFTQSNRGRKQFDAPTSRSVGTPNGMHTGSDMRNGMANGMKSSMGSNRPNDMPSGKTNNMDNNMAGGTLSGTGSNMASNVASGIGTPTDMPSGMRNNTNRGMSKAKGEGSGMSRNMYNADSSVRSGNDLESKGVQTGASLSQPSRYQGDSKKVTSHVGSMITNAGSRRASKISEDSEKDQSNGDVSREEIRGSHRSSLNSDTQGKIEELRESMKESIRNTVRTTMQKIVKSYNEGSQQESSSSHTDSEKERDLNMLFESLGVSESARNSILSAFSDNNRESKLEKAFERYGVSNSARNSIMSAFSEIDRETIRHTILGDASESTRNSILSELSDLDLDAVLMKALEDCSDSARNSILSTFAEIDKDEAIMKALEGASDSARNSILSAFAEIDKEEALAKALEGLSDSARESLILAFDEIDRDEALARALEALSDSARNSILSEFSELDKDEALMKALEGATDSTRNSILASFSEMDKEDAIAKAMEGLSESTRNSILSAFEEVDRESGVTRDYSSLRASRNPIQRNLTDMESEVETGTFQKPPGWQDCLGGETECCQGSFNTNKSSKLKYVSNKSNVFGDFDDVSETVGTSNDQRMESELDERSYERMMENEATDTTYDEPSRNRTMEYGNEPATSSVAAGPSTTEIPETMKPISKSKVNRKIYKSMGDIGNGVNSKKKSYGVPECRLAPKKKKPPSSKQPMSSYDTCQQMLCNEKDATCRRSKSTKRCVMQNKVSGARQSNQMEYPSFSIGTQIDMM